MLKLKTFGLLLAAAVVGLAGTASAQSPTGGLPTGTIKLIVPYTPGASGDIYARKLAERVSANTGANMIVENRPGGAQVPGALEVKQSTPDGRTLLWTDTPTFAINATLMPDLPYDPTKDFKGITTVWNFSPLLVVPAQTPARTMKELVDLAAKTPGGLSYASQGVGSGGHLCAAMFTMASSAKFEHVPYKGSAAAWPDVLSGKLAFFFDTFVGAKDFIAEGKVFPVAMTSKTRSKLLPNVPTTAEAGYPTVVMEFWSGVAAPAGVPDSLIKAYNEAFVKVLTAPDWVADLDSRGLTAMTTTPEQFQTLIKDTIVGLRPAIIASGAKPN